MSTQKRKRGRPKHRSFGIFLEMAIEYNLDRDKTVLLLLGNGYTPLEVAELLEAEFPNEPMPEKAKLLPRECYDAEGKILTHRGPPGKRVILMPPENVIVAWGGHMP